MNTTDNTPILVPIDFSAESKAALLYACDVSTSKGLPMIVLHVVHDSVNSDMYRRKSDESLLPLREIAERTMREFISDVKRENEHLDVLNSAQVMLVEGLPMTRIREVAQRTQAGHIIVGGKEKGRLSVVLNGSVSQSLTIDSPVPVTVFRSEPSKSNHDFKKEVSELKNSATKYLAEVEKSGEKLAAEAKQFFEQLASNVAAAANSAAKTTVSVTGKVTDVSSTHHLNRVMEEVKEVGGASLRAVGEGFETLRRQIADLTVAEAKESEKGDVKESAAEAEVKKNTKKKPAAIKKTAAKKVAGSRAGKKTAAPKKVAAKAVSKKATTKKKAERRVAVKKVAKARAGKRTAAVK